jgi:hypothetical protein
VKREGKNYIEDYIIKENLYNIISQKIQDLEVIMKTMQGNSVSNAFGIGKLGNFNSKGVCKLNLFEKQVINSTKT